MAKPGTAQTNWSTTPINGFWGEEANWTNDTPTRFVLANFTSSGVTTTFIASPELGPVPHTDRWALGLAFSGDSDFQVISNDGTQIWDPERERWISGSGTLWIYSSGISVAGGTQTISAPPRVTALPFPVVSDGQLIINNSLMMNNQLNGTVTFSGSGNTSVSSLSRRWPNETTNMSIVKDGAGTLTIHGAYSLPGNVTMVSVVPTTGTTTINQGTVSITAEANLGRDPGGYYRLEGEQVVYVPGAFNPSALTLNGGTLRAMAGFAIDDDARGVTLGPNGGTFEVPSAAHTLTIANVITGPGPLSTAGPGTLALSAANTYAGDTRPAAGTLLVSHAEALAGSTLDMAADDTGAVAFGSPTAYTLGGLKGSRDLDMGGKTLGVGANGEDTEYSGVLSNGALTKVGGGILTLSGASTYTGTTKIADGVLVLSASDTLATGSLIELAGGTLRTVRQLDDTSTVIEIHNTIKLTGDSVIDTQFTNNTHLRGVISDEGGSFGFTKRGARFLNLRTTNTYTGETILEQGTTYLQANGALGTTDGATTVRNGAWISLETTGYTLAETLYLDNGTLRISSTSGTALPWRGDIVLVSESSIQAKSSGENRGLIVIEGSISGDGRLLVGRSEAGNVRFANANTHTGDTRVVRGFLQLHHAEALAGSTLDMAAGDTGAVAFGTPAAYTLGGLKGSRDLDMGGKTLSVGANGEDTEYSGALSNGALTKVGGGILALSGTNTHSATTISEGTLQFVTDASLGAAGAGITLDGGMLEYVGSLASHAVDRPITLTADSFIKSVGWPESLRLTGKLTDDGGAFGFTLTRGPVALTNGTNDYDGPTIVENGGMLYVAADGVLGSTAGPTIVQSGGMISVDTNHTTPETLHLNGGVMRTSYGAGSTATWVGDVVLGADSTIRAKFDNGQSTLVVGGQISGGYGLKVGDGEAGIVKLTGNSIYTGATTVHRGTLVVDGSIATSSGLTLAAGTLLQGTGSVPALAGAGLVSPGNSPGILTATLLDPASGLDFAFEFTAAGPDYTSPAASLNDVLRLTDLSAPFAGPLSAGNEISLYLNVAEVAAGDVFRGGFYTDLGEDFSDLLDGATVSAFVALDGNGPNVFEGVGYYSLADAPWPLQLEAALRSVPAAADFGAGLIHGYVMQVKVVPEPSALFLAALALACLAWPLRRRAGR